MERCGRACGASLEPSVGRLSDCRWSLCVRGSGWGVWVGGGGVWGWGGGGGGGVGGVVVGVCGGVWVGFVLGGGAWLFFVNDAATSEIYTLCVHDALPISEAESTRRSCSSAYRG